MVETANFTSAVYKRNNNAFGMKPAVIRFTVSLGDVDGDGYANYKNLAQSVADLLLWFKFAGLTVPDNLPRYAKELKARAYYGIPEETYLQALQSWT
jgi:hypothetical protein